MRAKSVYTRALAVLMATAALWGAPQARAEYPDKPINVWIPFAAGGATQALIGWIGRAITDDTGQSLVPNYRGGMGGTIAAETAYRTAPDGYNLLMGSTGALAVGPAVMKVNFDPVKDFAPIALIATTPYVLVVNARLPVHNVAELVAYAKQHPGQLNFGSSGTGSTDHIAGEVLQKDAGIKFTHIPYKGIGPLMPDLLSGRLDVAILSPIPFKAAAHEGQLRAIGVTTEQRSPALPGVPSIAEQGFPGYNLYAWYGFLAPAHTPRAVVDRMNRATMKALANKDVAAYLKAQGLTAGSGSPAEFTRFVHNEIDLWKSLVQQTGVSIQ